MVALSASTSSVVDSVAVFHALALKVSTASPLSVKTGVVATPGMLLVPNLAQPAAP